LPFFFFDLPLGFGAAAILAFGLAFFGMALLISAAVLLAARQRVDPFS